MLNGHLFGIYEKAFPQGWNWETRLQAAEELGFDFVEISVDESDGRLKRLDWSIEERLALHRALEKSKVNIQSMCLSAHRRFPFGSADVNIRGRAFDIMEKAILFAKEFGIRVVQLAGYDVYYEDSTPESRKLFLDGLKWASKMAQRHQIMLAMEIMDTPLMNSISRYIEYKREINSPWFTVYPDIGNLSAWGNDVEQELQIGRNEIVAMHLKDTLAVTKSFEGKFKCVPFGSGCVDFERAFRLLDEIEYCGPFMVEMWYQEGQNAKENIKKAVNFIEEKYRRGTNKELRRN